MEQINNQYIKLNRIDVFIEIAKSLKQKNTSKREYFHNLIYTIMSYEKENNQTIDNLFLNKSDFNDQDLINIPITRQSLINAYIFANINNDIIFAYEIKKILPEKYILPNELGHLKNYILTNNIDLNEYYDGEKLKFIYNYKENIIEQGYIYNSNNITKKLQL